MFLSFALQVVAVAAGIVISIFTVDKLGAFSLPRPMPPAPRTPKPVHLVATKPVALGTSFGGIRMPARPFVVPSRITDGLPVIVDGPEMQLTQNLIVGDPSASIATAIGSSTGVPQASPMQVLAPPSSPPRREPRDTKPNLRVGGDVLEAKLVKRVMPQYPPLARQMRLSGTVRLEGVIARNGRVVNLQVISGHPMLVASALEAVRQWVYRPTLLNGEAVEVIAPIDVRFILSQ
jgi:periplasmic protein TonB